MIRSIYVPKGGPARSHLSQEELTVALQDQEGLLWVSLEHPREEETQSVLRDLFHFHPLAIEDCLSQGYQAPKVDDFGPYIFIISHAIQPATDFREIETMELNLFLSENYLVTFYQESAMPCVEHVWQRLKQDERLLANGADFLCHAVLDRLVDEYMPLLDQMDEEIEWLEDSVLARPDPSILERILALKHSVMSLRRIVSPQREVINRLSRDDFPQIDRLSRIYYRDIYDHLVRIQDLTESIRDIVSGSLDIYLSSTSLRLNEIMKALTVVSTIFLPLSFLAGVYGMNFPFIPEFTWKYGYWFAWGVFIFIGLGMLAYFKKKGWF
ncbi:MAG: magnesium/cobalt transporter CorA [Chloroflexi bacterium]|nr:magnesium/cobalt transporter CorA [Anaerolineaceae bacterium]NMB90599.1 magnesium/cobalt transporter CorA [Chloroflexota bacterium]